MSINKENSNLGNILIFVKLGGSIITDKQQRYHLQEKNIERLAGELSSTIKQDSRLKVIIGHGSGSFGHASAQEYGITDASIVITNPKAIAHINSVTQQLHQLVLQILIGKGLDVMSYHPSSSGSHIGDRFKINIEPLVTALDNGLTPLLHGDLVTQDGLGWRIRSTEEIFNKISIKLKPDRVVLVGLVDGIFTGDPLNDSKANLIKEITPQNIKKVITMLSSSHGIDVTGGMKTKIQIMYQILKTNPNATIHFISGTRETFLSKILMGNFVEPSTVMHI